MELERCTQPSIVDTYIYIGFSALAKGVRRNVVRGRKADARLYPTMMDANVLHAKTALLLSSLAPVTHRSAKDHVSMESMLQLQIFRTVTSLAVHEK